MIRPHPWAGLPGQPRSLPVPAYDPLTPEELKQWPSLTLRGIAGRGKNGSAMINDDIVGIGETVERVRVISIVPHGVLIELNGRQQFLKVGNSTK